MHHREIEIRPILTASESAIQATLYRSPRDVPKTGSTFVDQDDSCGSAAVVTYTARDTFNGH